MRIRFAALSEACNLLLSRTWDWVTCVLVVGLVTMAAGFLNQLIFLPSDLGDTAKKNALGLDIHTPLQDAAFLVGSVPVSALSFILMTCLQRKALLQRKGLVSDLTQLVQLDGQGKQVALLGLFLAAAGIPAQFCFNRCLFSADSEFSHGPSLALILSVLGVLSWNAFCMLASFGPLMIIDQKLTWRTALTQSLRTLARHFWPLLGLNICTLMLSISGGLACCVGIVFTLPLTNIVPAIVYCDFFQPTSFFERP